MNELTRGLLLAVFVVVVITAWPLWVNADFYFVHPSLQILDFASNDMLVVEAKKLSLLHGHYSRAGFYHPGPFYLYWMAGWEKLLADIWPVFSSPAAAQHFSATLLMALSFGCLAFLTHKISGKASTALAATATVFALVHATAGNVITAPWPPQMFAASALLTICGSVGLLAFGWRWLPLLCFGALQLLHGHASFFGLLPLMLLPVILVAVKLHKLPHLKDARYSLLLTAGIVALMCAPLAVITVANFPQPWLSYLHQAGTGQPLGAKAGLRLLASFAWVQVFALPLLLPEKILLRHASSPWRVSFSRLRLIAWTVTTGALLAGAWFAIRGVDDAGNRYLLFWLAPYCAMPAALAVTSCANALPRLARLFLCLSLVLASWFNCRAMLPWMWHNAPQYANYQNSYRQLQALTDKKPLVLSIDKQMRYGDIWSQLLTLAAWSKRDGTALFCLAPDSWQLSFHQELLCTAQQLNDDLHLLVFAGTPTAGDGLVTSLEGINYSIIKNAQP